MNSATNFPAFTMTKAQGTASSLDSVKTSFPDMCLSRSVWGIESITVYCVRLDACNSRNFRALYYYHRCPNSHNVQKAASNVVEVEFEHTGCVRTRTCLGLVPSPASEASDADSHD
jgi:hypothetical protein